MSDSSDLLDALTFECERLRKERNAAWEAAGIDVTKANPSAVPQFIRGQRDLLRFYVSAEARMRAAAAKVCRDYVVHKRERLEQIVKSCGDLSKASEYVTGMAEAAEHLEREIRALPTSSEAER